MDRRRDREIARVRPILGQHREHLLDEQRIALRRVRDADEEVGAQLGFPTEELEQHLGFGGRERLERDRRCLWRRRQPARVAVGQIGPREADDQDGRFAAPADQVLDQVEELGLRPLEVVEGDDQRPLTGDVLEQPAYGRPHRLLGPARASGDSDRAGHAPGDVFRIRLAVEQFLDPRLRQLAGCLADEITERPVRDSLSVGKAATVQYRSLLLDVGEQLADEAGLSDSRRADHLDDSALLQLCGFVERRPQPAELSFATDHGRVEPPGKGGGARHDAQQAPRLDRLRLPLQQQGLDRLDEHRLAHELESRAAHQDLTGSRGCLEALGDGDRIAGREGLSLSWVAGYDLARVDPGANGELHPELLAQLLVQLGECLPQLCGRPDRAQRVVLVHDRDPEDGHDRVADELLHGAPVALQHAADLDEVARHRSPVRLRVESLAERGRVDDVGEHERDGLPHLSRRRGLLEGSATGETEPGTGGVRLATACTGGHVPSEYGPE